MVVREGDYLKEIIDYIQSNLSKGYHPDQIRILLIKQGYSRSAIGKAFRMVEQMPKLAPQPIVVEQPKTEIVMEEPAPEKKGFFAKLKGFFSKAEKSSSEDKVNVDSQGNVMK